MANYNRVVLAGNMTRDPELAHTSANTPICKFGMAINRRWRDRNSGENREETCFVDCVAFSGTAETIQKYFTKGKPILVEGRLNFSQWEAQDGSKRSKLDVIVERFEFLGGPATGGGPGSGRSRTQAAAPEPSNEFSPPNHDDDVPF